MIMTSSSTGEVKTVLQPATPAVTSSGCFRTDR
jgi:hypothetical protein